MDPHYFEEKADLETFVEQVKLIRKVAKSEPFASLIGTSFWVISFLTNPFL